MARTDDDTWDLASEAEVVAIGDVASAAAAMSRITITR
jgi:hypothetical protein